MSLMTTARSQCMLKTFWQASTASAKFVIQSLAMKPWFANIFMSGRLMMIVSEMYNENDKHCPLRASNVVWSRLYEPAIMVARHRDLESSFALFGESILRMVVRELPSSASQQVCGLC